MSLIDVRIFSPTDPLGIVPGGIDTFIRGMIKWAPEDIRISLVGMTTDNEERPPRRWMRCALGGRDFDFYPAVHVANAGSRSRVPLSLRYTAAIAMTRSAVLQDFSVFDFHRIEPELVFRGDPRPKNAFFHSDPTLIRNPNSSILWKHAPKLYDRIERNAVARFSSIWCVRTEVVELMRARYQQKRDVINFVPTWVDTEIFSPLPDDDRARTRQELAVAYALDKNAAWIVSVGRLDTEKDPRLLVAAFARLAQEDPGLHLLIIGDGTLRASVKRQIDSASLGGRVHLLGLMGSGEIARILAASDVFALSSAYEGMPMAVLEALGSGLPVATTDVGEVRRVVRPGINGAIAANRSVEAFSACLKDAVLNRRRYLGAPAVAAIQDYRPSGVLEPVFDNYRELAAQFAFRRGRP